MRLLALPCLLFAVIAAVPSSVPRTDGCPSGFVRVSGEYCPNVVSTCLDWMDPIGSNPRRCREYSPSSCGSKTITKDFCMQRTEYTEAQFVALQSSDHPVKSVHQQLDPKSMLPITKVDFWQAQDICQAEGATLCDEQQFEMACEGTAYHNYPVGQRRDCAKCNCDVSTNIGADFEHRVDHRKPVNEVAECRSDYGIEGLVGNADEWVRRTKSFGSYVSVLRGGHWLPIRARCTPDATTTGHGPTFSSLEVGFRCCDTPR